MEARGEHLLILQWISFPLHKSGAMEARGNLLIKLWCFPLMPIKNTNFHRIWTIEWFLWTQLLRQILIVSSYMDLSTQLWTQIVVTFGTTEWFPHHSEFIYGSLNPVINSNFRRIWTTEWFLTIVKTFMDLWTQLLTQIFATFKQLYGFLTIVSS